jgi:hypothetical protein
MTARGGLRRVRGGSSPPWRNDNKPPQPPLHRCSPALGYVASRRFNPNGCFIPLPPPALRHDPSSLLDIQNI